MGGRGPTLPLQVQRALMLRPHFDDGGAVEQGAQASLPGTAETLAALGSGHAVDDLQAYARDDLPRTGAGFAAYLPGALMRQGVDGAVGTARYADDALHGRLGTDLCDPATVERMVSGAVRTAGMVLPPGMGMTEEGALGVAGGAAMASDRFTLDASTLGDINELPGLGRNWKAPDPYAANNAAIQAYRDAGSPPIPRAGAAREGRDGARRRGGVAPPPGVYT